MARKTTKRSNIGPDNRLRNILALRGTEEWRAWAFEFTTHCGKKHLTDLIDDALATHARAMGFAKPTPARAPARRRPLDPKKS